LKINVVEHSDIVEPNFPFGQTIGMEPSPIFAFLCCVRRQLRFETRNNPLLFGLRKDLQVIESAICKFDFEHPFQAMTEAAPTAARFFATEALEVRAAQKTIGQQFGKI
jgi:hypothetical protein